MERLILAVLIWLALPFAGTGLRAQDGAVLAIPDDLLALLTDRPARLLDRAAELVRGYGDGNGITAAGIALSVASERAAARASALRVLLALDLDGDLAVPGAEAAQATSVLSARARGKLLARLDAADLDGDGGLDLAELVAAGNVAAMRAVSTEEEAERHALLALDLDGDGVLRLEEVEDALAAADAAAGKPAERPPDVGKGI